MATTTFTLNGQVSVEVVITELGDGTLHFTVTVPEGNLIADLQGLFFDVADNSLVSGLQVTGTDATDWQFVADKVTNLGEGVNVNGEVVKEFGAFDAGVQIGTQGIGVDDIQTTSFIISHTSVSLTLADILSQDFAVRLTSVGEVDGARTGSLKIGGTSPDYPDPEDNPPDAIDDQMTVGNLDSFADGFDILDNGAASILANDLDGTGGAYAGLVTGVNGAASGIGTVVVGSNGGLLIVEADGSVNFSANGEFGFVTGRDFVETTFTYEIDGGDIATIVVTVNGFNNEL